MPVSLWRTIRLLTGTILIVTAMILAVQIAAVAVPTPVPGTQGQTPFEGMYLLYSVQMPYMTQSQSSSFSGTARFTFRNISENSCSVDMETEGTTLLSGVKQPIEVKQRFSMPTNQNTIFYLKANPQPGSTYIVGPRTTEGELLTGDYQYKDTRLIRFPEIAKTLKAHEFQRRTSIGNVVLDIYLYYETDTRVMVYAALVPRYLVLSTTYKATLTETNASLSGTSPPRGSSRCLIATAAYGSDLSPQVQFLRMFRDDQVTRTLAGRSFMLSFNGWYYSFSPSIARIIAKNEVLSSAARVALYPLISELRLSSSAYSAFSSHPEVAVLVSGLIASIMIGVTYLSVPFSVCLAATDRKPRDIVTSKFLIILLSVFVGAVVSIDAAESLGSTEVMMIATSTFVVSMMILGALVPSIVSAAVYWKLARIIGRGKDSSCSQDGEAG